MASSDLTLRERKKLRTRNELAAAALAMFAERGFDNVTIEEIAAAVEVSPSTFLRYFERKEDVLLVDDARRFGQLTAALAARPADEPVLEVVRHAVVALAEAIEDDRETIMAKARLMLETPSLRARSLENQTRVEQLITDAVASRLGTDPEDDLRARLVAATSMAAVRVAVESWLARDAGEPLSRYLGTALEMLDGGLSAAISPRPGRRASSPARKSRA